jgi:peptide/nickel transport system substrate-binding protein
MRIKLFLPIFLIIVLLIPSCQKESSSNQNRVIVGISADPQSLNPLFVYTFEEVNISDQLFLSLVQQKWNDSLGIVESIPMLATNWTWNSDSTSITVNLRKDVLWSDNVPVTVKDVIFSFDMYSDPQVQSRLYGTFENFYVDKNQHILIKKTFDVINPYKFIIKLNKKTAPSLFNIDFPIIPEHVYKNVDRKNIVTEEKNLKFVTDGAFNLSSWKKNQAIILKTDKKSFLYNTKNISELIFKIIPDYNSRLLQLKNGEIDIIDHVRPQDVAGLKNNTDIKLKSIKGREYEYVGWNNIDPAAYKKGYKIIPNKIFGSPKVREALSYAINKEEILNEYLNGYGDLAVGPVAPIFKSFIDTSLKPLKYNPEKAKELLSEEGWKDLDNDGILEKDNRKFSFVLDISGNNARRKFAAEIIKNNLQAIGIDVKVESLEFSVYNDKMYGHELNAWIGGWVVPIPITLKPFWFSDLMKSPLNVSGFQNKEVDKTLDQMEKASTHARNNETVKQFQRIIYRQNPVTFLYWIDNIVAYNNRIKDIQINPLGYLHHCWKWSNKD